MRRADVDELIDGIAGVTLTAFRACLRGVRRVVVLRSGAASSRSCSRCAPRLLRSALRWPTSSMSRRWTSNDRPPDRCTRGDGEHIRQQGQRRTKAIYVGWPCVSVLFFFEEVLVVLGELRLSISPVAD